MYDKLRKPLRLFGLFLLEFGIDVRRIINLRHLFQFLKDYWGFIRLGGKIDHNYVILRDYNDEAGTAKGHYYHQDLLVAAFV